MTSLRLTPCAEASPSASRIRVSIASRSSAASAGIGLAISSPPPPSPKCAAITAAICSALSQTWSTASPLSGVKKAGKAAVRWPITGTPCVSSTSKVLGMSRIDFAPAETTATGVRPSSIRSAEMSKLASAPRCTPPIPPVAKTAIPARAAIAMVAATVVPAVPPCTISGARSRREALATPFARPSRSSAASSSPAVSRPSSTAMVAGTAPSARTTASSASAVSTFCGQGMPWVMMVDSSATTALPSACAAATSALRSIPIIAPSPGSARACPARAAVASPGPRR